MRDFLKTDLVFNRAKLDAYLPKLEEKCDVLLSDIWSSHADDRPNNDLLEDYFSLRKRDMKENLGLYKEKLKAKLQNQTQDNKVTQLAEQVDNFNLFEVDLNQMKQCSPVNDRRSTKRRQSFFQVLDLAGNLDAF